MCMHRYMRAGKHIDMQRNMYLYLIVFIHSYTKDLQKLPSYTELHAYTKTSITHPSLYTCVACATYVYKQYMNRYK